MNASLIFGLLATTSLSMLTPGISAAGDCEPRVVESPTRFPLRSQERGHKGTVYLKISVGADGRATSADLHRSSGHRMLDRAASQSVRSRWIFDVSNCQRKDLPADHLIAVEYRNEEY